MEIHDSTYKTPFTITKTFYKECSFSPFPRKVCEQNGQGFFLHFIAYSVSYYYSIHTGYNKTDTNES